MSPPSPSPSAAAARVLAPLLGGEGSLSDLLPKALDGLEDPRDRSLASELCYGTLRWKTRLDALSGRLLKAPLRNRDLDEDRVPVMGCRNIDAQGPDGHLGSSPGKRPGLRRMRQGRLAEPAIVQPMGGPGLQGWDQDRPLLNDQLFCGQVQRPLGGGPAVPAARMGEVPGAHVPLAGDQHLPALGAAAVASLAAGDLLDRD